MDPRTKSAVLWGLVGALSFGVLYNGYVLLGANWAPTLLVGGMLAVGVVTILLALRLEGRFAAEES